MRFLASAIHWPVFHGRRLAESTLQTSTDRILAIISSLMPDSFFLFDFPIIRLLQTAYHSSTFVFLQFHPSTRLYRSFLLLLHQQSLASLRFSTSLSRIPFLNSKFTQSEHPRATPGNPLAAILQRIDRSCLSKGEKRGEKQGEKRGEKRGENRREDREGEWYRTCVIGKVGSRIEGAVVRHDRCSSAFRGRRTGNRPVVRRTDGRTQDKYTDNDKLAREKRRPSDKSGLLHS